MCHLERVSKILKKVVHWRLNAKFLIDLILWIKSKFFLNIVILLKIFKLKLEVEDACIHMCISYKLICHIHVYL